MKKVLAPLFISFAIGCDAAPFSDHQAENTAIANTTACRNWSCDPAKTVSVGYSSSCAALSSGGVMCWGGNKYGQLGNGNDQDASVAAPVVGLNNVQALSVGGANACAVTVDGKVYCWGDNEFGELGNGATENSNVPVKALGLNNATDVSCGGYHCCAITQGGALSCWGHLMGLPAALDIGTDHWSIPTDVSAVIGAPVISVAMGDERACAVLIDGSAVCFGNNGFGALGCGDALVHSDIVPVSGLANAAKIVLGKNHSCALVSDGTVFCWGWNAHGLLGNNEDYQASYEKHYSAMPVSGVDDAVDLAAGEEHTCAAKRDGTVVCWGVNTLGQIGFPAGGEFLPTAIPNFRARAISAQLSFNCSIGPIGEVACWGYNGYGQLGNGTTEKSAGPIGVLRSAIR